MAWGKYIEWGQGRRPGQPTLTVGQRQAQAEQDAAQARARIAAKKAKSVDVPSPTTNVDVEDLLRRLDEDSVAPDIEAAVLALLKKRRAQ